MVKKYIPKAKGLEVYSMASREIEDNWLERENTRCSNIAFATPGDEDPVLKLIEIPRKRKIIKSNYSFFFQNIRLISFADIFLSFLKNQSILKLKGWIASK